MRRHAWFVIAVLVVCSRVMGATVEYVVGLGRVHEQLVEIEMRVTGWEKPVLAAHLPVWRPGKYAILDLAGAIRTVNATGGSGNELPVEKFEKSSWRVQAGGERDITLRYTIYANALGERTRHADDTHAFLSGSAVFMYVHELRNQPARVRINAPEGWRIASGLANAEPGVLSAPNYDVLVDSPIEVGVHRLASFTVDGVEFEFAIWGETTWADRESGINLKRLLEDTEKIARTQIAMFGGFPAKRYVILLHVAPGASGGTEHLNSTICQTRPETFESEKSYQGLMGLLAHEIFHTWNVKAFRPKDLSPYDYQRENYTTLLWLAEGTTDYYDGLTPVRAGVQKPKEYLESLGTLIREERDRPGGAVQSVEASSYDSWIKFNRPSPDAANSTVSFYSRGALVNLALDMHLRRVTKGEKSLDDVMRELWVRFPVPEKGYTTEDLLAIGGDIAGEPLTDFYESFIRQPKWPPLAELLGTVGLELYLDKDEKDVRTAIPYLGLRLRDDAGGPVVTAVLSDGPGAAAGILVDDQIVALDGKRVRGSDLEGRLKEWKPESPVSVTLFRRENLREVRFVPASREPGTLKLRKVKEPTQEQKVQFKSWLGVAWEDG